MKAAKTIWLVKGEGPSSAIHYRKETAVDEANRLAIKNPSTLFYVMEAVEAFRGIEGASNLSSDTLIPLYEVVTPAKWEPR